MVHWTVCRLYGQVREFSPAREEEVIVIQQVKEILGEEGGWDSVAWHGFTTMSIHTRQEIWYVRALISGS